MYEALEGMESRFAVKICAACGGHGEIHHECKKVEALQKNLTTQTKNLEIRTPPR